MKIAIAQIKPISGAIDANVEKHMHFIELAANAKVGGVFFSELSITAYEPQLASKLKIRLQDQKLDVFQEISDKRKITIGIGAPTIHRDGVQISMIIFQAQQDRTFYSKQILHNDEEAYFVQGKMQKLIDIKGYKIAPAICYESMQVEHLDHSIDMGANLYLASVAKSQNGIEKVNLYFPQVAKQKCIPILMSNSIGPCDNFMAAGQSAIWNKQGKLLRGLPASEEGLLIYDTASEHTSIISL